MPIVDGLTSTKMIRSFEKSHPTSPLSDRAAVNGRVPIIAVSASLIEKDRQVYIDAGFDGWILKPISFPRLSEIMEGIENQQTRKTNIYKRGSWERGGWFHESEQPAITADTRPSGEPPQQAPGVTTSSEGVKIAAVAEDPAMKEENFSKQSTEQKRLLEDQNAKKEEYGS